MLQSIELKNCFSPLRIFQSAIYSNLFYDRSMSTKGESVFEITELPPLHALAPELTKMLRGLGSGQKPWAFGLVSHKLSLWK